MPIAVSIPQICCGSETGRPWYLQKKNARDLSAAGVVLQQIPPKRARLIAPHHIVDLRPAHTDIGEETVIEGLQLALGAAARHIADYPTRNTRQEVGHETSIAAGLAGESGRGHGYAPCSSHRTKSPSAIAPGEGVSFTCASHNNTTYMWSSHLSARGVAVMQVCIKVMTQFIFF
jgi:hypothetical protein